MTFSIQVTLDSSIFVEEIIKLHDKNKKTLGFLSDFAFRQKSKEGKIIVAHDDKKNFLGYLLYDTNRRSNSASIAYLCVDAAYQKSDVGTHLIDKLKEETKLYKAIRVHCRRDYEMGDFWKKQGFVAKSEKRGRSVTMETRLDVWWFDHHSTPLFNEIHEEKIKIIIDSNIFFDLQDEIETDENKAAKALLNDWLQIILYLTPETFNEISRKQDIKKRSESQKFAMSGRFKEIQSLSELELKLYKEKLAPFIQPKSDNDESDLCHLAYVLANEFFFFVTRDNELLKKADDIYEQLGIRIVKPDDVILYLDQLAREEEYRPVILTNEIKTERLQSQQVEKLVDIFHFPNERKSELRKQLQGYLNPKLFEIKYITKSNQPIALIVYNKNNVYDLEIPFCRISKNNLTSTLARYIVFSTILDSVKNEKQITRFTNVLNNESDDLHSALQENRFFKVDDNSWIRANPVIIGDSSAICNELNELSKHFTKASCYFEQLINNIAEATLKQNYLNLLELEKSILPAKITNINISCFVVSIKPVWAMNFFDYDISKQDIFGGKSKLILNLENAYYRSKTPNILCEPSRILWYVSSSGNKRSYYGEKAIKAGSYLDEIHIDKAKKLYSKYRHLGIYEWKDVFGVAKQNLEQEIMAFKFSFTESFKYPISRERLNSIWEEKYDKQFNIQPPIEIKPDLYFELYKIGFGLD